MKKMLEALGIFLRGMAMGAADVVPGVSGGTIAFITGIYERFIKSLRSFDFQALRLLFKFEIKACWRHVDGNFILFLFAGVLTSIFSLAHSIDYLLDNYPILVWSLFLGLIAASAVLFSRKHGSLNPFSLVFLVVGIALVVLVARGPESNMNPGLLVVFGAGVIAISAMLLPGLSGSFLLVLMGLYEPLLEAVKGLEATFLLSFACGAVTGLVSFSHIIHWLLKHHPLNTMMFLIGLLYGSLYAIWPWRSADGKSPVLPMGIVDSDPMILPAFGCMILGILVVCAIEYGASRMAALTIEDS